MLVIAMGQYVICLYHSAQILNYNAWNWKICKICQSKLHSYRVLSLLLGGNVKSIIWNCVPIKCFQFWLAKMHSTSFEITLLSSAFHFDRQKCNVNHSKLSSYWVFLLLHTLPTMMAALHGGQWWWRSLLSECCFLFIIATDIHHWGIIFKPWH